jgi:hypothetical protein
MATAQMRAAVQYELRALADYDATLAELLDHLDERNDGFGGNRFSDDQEEELQLYCWALRHCKSTGLTLGASRVPRALEDDIGA